MGRLIYAVVLYYCVSSVLITQSSATFGTGCSSVDDCTVANNEICGTDGKCACKPGFKENAGTCEATFGTGCSSAADCTVANNEICGTDGKCACKPGFKENAGTCEDINECQSNPCLNGATCDDIVNGYTCTCVAGWSGTMCDTFNCHDGTCQNSGTCDTGETTCTCVAGYTGDDCGTVPSKSAGKTAMTAVILMMAVLTNILMQMF